MHNYYHEIPLPVDKAIRKFLWVSYFHDGLIRQILPGQPKPYDLTLQIYSGHDGYTYHLRFHNAVHFECSVPPYGWHVGIDISSTTFKDSALLHRLQAEEGKPLYHLRFSHWDGYTDVIFERFTIRREGGRVNYKSEVPMEAIGWQHCRYTPEGAYLADIDPFEEDFADLPVDDEEDRLFMIDNILWARLYHLEQRGMVDELVKQARFIIAEHPRCENAPVYAAFLLGKHGSRADIHALTKQFLLEQNLLKKRVILDAMELIQERTSN